MTSRLEDLEIGQGPDGGTPPGAAGARQRGPDRRFVQRRQTPTATSDEAHRRQDPQPSAAGPPDAGVEQRHGVIVVTPVGTLPDPLPAGLVQRLETSILARPVIVDLSLITLVSPAPVMGLTGWVLGANQQPDQCCVVCPRATARALLRKWHVTRCVAIFGSVGDALQARRFADEGYGTGWHPDRPPLAFVHGPSRAAVTDQSEGEAASPQQGELELGICMDPVDRTLDLQDGYQRSAWPQRPGAKASDAGSRRYAKRIRLRASLLP